MTHTPSKRRGQGQGSIYRDAENPAYSAERRIRRAEPPFANNGD
jgi:hypothetical protein